MLRLLYIYHSHTTLENCSKVSDTVHYPLILINKVYHKFNTCIVISLRIEIRWYIANVKTTERQFSTKNLRPRQNLTKPVQKQACGRQNKNYLYSGQTKNLSSHIAVHHVLVVLPVCQEDDRKKGEKLKIRPLRWNGVDSYLQPLLWPINKGK